MFSRSLAGAQILHWRSGSQTVDGTYRSANNHLFHAALFTLVIDNVCVCVRRFQDLEFLLLRVFFYQG